jgi:hypothetical protein
LSCHQKIQSWVTFPVSAPMKWDCKECHKPHQAQMPTVDCTSCHAQIRSEGLHSKKTHSETACQVCHKPHEWKVTTRDPCMSCHTDKTQHNPGKVCVECHDFRKAISATGAAARVQEAPLEEAPTPGA